MTILPERSTEGSRSLDAVFDCLADADRRRLVAFLLEKETQSATPGELAPILVSGSKSHERESEEVLQDALVSLHHSHLPKLEDAGLVHRKEDEVALTDHSAYRDPGIIAVLGPNRCMTSDSLDALFGALAEHRRRSILDVLSHQFGPIHVETLARELGAIEQKSNESDLPVESVETILVSLKHVHLPTLVDADLITHNTTADTVSYKGHPDLRVPWMHSVLAPDFRSSLTGAAGYQEVSAIQGRERIVSYGQSLCDRANTELFCLFTRTDLIEAGCLTRIRDASNRGVEVYLGTCDPTVQTYVLENAPNVKLWEPESNWLDLPVAGNDLGRLLLADREAVMLGTLANARDGHTEQAIVGDGVDNALVVMVTQLIRPYLEQIDGHQQAFPPRTRP